MDKIIVYFTPDMREPYAGFKNEILYEECADLLEYISRFGVDVYSRVLATTLDNERIFSIYMFEPQYYIDDKYKYLEDDVKEFIEKFFKIEEQNQN